MLLGEEAFAAVGGEEEACERTGTGVIVRLLDPEGRKDVAGRVIPHDFLIGAEAAAEIRSLADARRRVRPLIAGRYAEVWDKPRPGP